MWERVKRCLKFQHVSKEEREPCTINTLTCRKDVKKVTIISRADSLPFFLFHKTFVRDVKFNVIFFPSW